MRVLIVRVGAMGDVLHALPAAAALRRERPEWVVDWVVDPRWATLLVNGEGQGPIVRQVHLAKTQIWRAAPFSSATRRSLLALRDAISVDPYDLVVDMQGTLRSAVIGKAAGARAFAGYADPRERLAALLYERRIARRGEHVVEQGAALLGDAAGVTLAPAAVALPREGWAEEWAEALVGREAVAVLSPRAGWVAKQWPAESFGALAKRLQAMGLRVLVNAPREDEESAAAVVATAAGAAERVVCNVAGLAALVRRAKVLVGGDSGPVHLAAALQTPVVALFGPTDPARNGPWGAGRRAVLRPPEARTSYKRSRTVDAGLAEMSVETVLSAVQGVI